MIKYSATISATDSVAALTLIKASEFPKIFSIIFGEGMVNDAVAIILFKVVGKSRHIQEESLISSMKEECHQARQLNRSSVASYRPLFTPFSLGFSRVIRKLFSCYLFFHV
jgi:hypothetical protein